MRFLHTAALLSVLCAFAGMAATPAAKTTSHRKAKSAAKKAGAKKATGKTAKATGKLAKGKKPAPAASWRTRQQAPTSDRYREIQQALMAKGYLKTEPSGVWDADSVNAMQHFQSDQKITASGKINAPSLIALGLGAKSAGAPEAAPLPGAPPPAAAPASPPPPAAPQ